MAASANIDVLGIGDKMKKMRFAYPMVAAFALAGSADAVTVVQVGKQDITSTQAIVRVRTDQPGFCTYRVSEGPGFSAMVNDVNPAIFSGANSDGRDGSIITGISSGRGGSPSAGSEHVFVAGTRTAARGADGKFYSRALQANTLHWVGVTCGLDAEVSTIFQTLNLPLGNDGPELMPFDPTAFGNVAVPTIDWVNRSTSYVDPLWGTQLHRMTDPTDVAFYLAGQTFTYGISTNGHWSNPGNAIAAGSSSLATCDTSAGCATSDALALIAVIPTDNTNYRPNGAWDTNVSYLDFLVKMWGSGTDASAANRTVAVCWSIDDQTCFTSSQNIVLPQSSPGFAGTAPQSWSIQSPWSGAAATALSGVVVANGTATVNFATQTTLTAGGQICINGIRNSVTTAQGGNGLNGCHVITSAGYATVSFPSNAYPATYTDGELIASANFPQAQWASWGTPPLHASVGERKGGTVTATGGVLVLTSNSWTYSNFDTTWTAGTRIYIAGSSPTCANSLCTVASVQDAQDLTLVENLTISGADWTSANFSLLVQKTTSIGAVSVSAGYDFVDSANYASGLDGSGDICNSNYVTVSVDAAGNPISPSLQGYLCVASASGISGAINPVYLFIPSTGESRLIARTYQASANDYRPWVGWHPTNGAAWFVNYPGQSVFEVVYTGDFRALTPGFPQTTTEPGTPEQLTFTDIFAGTGNDMATQMANCVVNGTCNTAINATIFGVPPSPPQTGAAIRGNYMVLCGGAIGGTQDGPGYMTLWNIGSTPAVLAWAGYSFDAFPVGYAGVHACLSFGTGQYNTANLNGNGGQVGGALRGPWQQTPIMYNSGSGYTSNTAVTLTDGMECPANLSPQWQALGAKPLAQGGVARCLEFKVPGDFCSVNATAAESAAFPCPWNAASNYSLIKPIGEGDELSDATAGAVTWGEKMLVVKVTRNSTTDIDLWVFRYSSQSQTPASGFTCGTYQPSEWNHANGWTMYAMPYHGCYGSMYWINAADATHTYLAEAPNALGGHPDFGEGSGGYTLVNGATLSGYITRANEPMPGQIGTPPTAHIVADPTFGSAQLPDIYLQSYVSKRQRRVIAPLAEMDWALDVRHYNPGEGNGAETPEGLFGNTATLVASHASTYLITFAGSQAPDPKITGFIGWAGYHMLADASGPNSAGTFGDTTPWHYCYAYAAGECASGSAAGQMYVSVPQDSSSLQCFTNTYAYNAPCISNNYPYGFWVTQFNTTQTDNVGVSSRRLTSALVAPGRQYNFTNAKSTPDGEWAQVQAQWLEGQRTDMFWVKLPPFPPVVSNPGTAQGATNLTLQLSGVAGDLIRAAFGYAENGDPAQFYCTSRAEACYTSASSSQGNPFVFASEAPSFTACSNSCSVSIPAIPGRILYYQVQTQRRNGLHTNSAVGAIAVQ
jgi:hypothetical protein